MRLSLTLFLLAVELVAPPLVFSGGAPRRCQQVVQEVRRRHASVFGTDFPYHYAVGQLEQESGCRNVVSRDGVGSQGLPQVTWTVWRTYLQQRWVVDLASVENQLQAQAYINQDAWMQARPRRLWIALQIYNGGRLVLKEIAAAGVADHAEARKFCRRKVVVFKSGQRIDACEINYEYPEKIAVFAEAYRAGPDSPLFPYW